MEIEVLALLGDSFSLNVNASYLDASFESVLDSAFLAADDFRAGVNGGSELPKTPEFQFNISPRYEWSIRNGASLVLLADYTWTDELWNDTERTYLLKRESTENLNLSVSYEPGHQNWKLTFGGKNLTDERNLTTGFSQPGTGILSGTYSRGSEWYASFSYTL